MTTGPSGTEAGHRIVSTVLRHDRKVNSYKIALLRALNDVVLAYPDLRHEGRDVAVPLRLLAESWVAYYWPFVATKDEILQGPRSQRRSGLAHDMGFRPHLRELRIAWERIHGPSGAAGGWLLVEHLRVPRTRAGYDARFVKQYRGTLRRIGTNLRQPLRYAGEGEWSLFAKPRRLREMTDVVAVPGTGPTEACTLVPPGLWRAFRDVSLWVEALAIHEWSLLTERVGGVSRGRAYELLTERPDNRLPLSWERNGVELLMREGHAFTCPWTGRRLTPARYQLDHVVPVAVHPFHELWNLVPADPHFNMHRKRDRLPGAAALAGATPHLGVDLRRVRGFSRPGGAAARGRAPALRAHRGRTARDRRRGHRSGREHRVAPQPGALLTRVGGRTCVRTRHDKLIRDRIPEIMDAEGVRYETRRLDDAAYRRALRAKLVEEAQEAAAADTPDALRTELADLLEVVRHLATTEGLEAEAVEATRAARHRARGGFARRLWLHWTER
ncbi:MAG: hypothetical protein U5K81_16280 [Trueperaceae bacterium]|nr:hypothetical protein [Trueperaceae bacterium]